MIELCYPRNGDELSIMTPAFHEYINRQKEGYLNCRVDDEWINDFLPEGDTIREFFNSSQENLSHPAKIFFRWKNDDPFRLMKLQISHDESFASNASYLNFERIFFMAGEEGTYCCPVSNFETGRQYYWCVIDDRGDRSETRSFTTPENEIRSIFIEGGSNVRDLGGRKTSDGRYVKQGLLYRGVELEDDEVRDHRLTSEGRKTFYSELGIRTDLDLREEAVDRKTRSGSWGGVKHVIRPCYCWNNTLEGIGAQWMRRVMDIVLNPSYYPIYFHCYAGADRTGTVAAYIEMLLGFPYESVQLDFNITSLSCYDKRNWYLHGYREETLRKMSERYPDEKTNSGLIKAYLIDLGIKKQKIDAFLNYMIEER